jgi:hypothetical protein
MSIKGTDGSGNQFSDRFSSGDVISASQLNSLINGISTTLPQPYLGAGASISYGAGGTVITTQEPDQVPLFSFALTLVFNGEKVNHYEVAVVGYDTGSGILGFAMKVAKGGNIWRPVGSDCDSELRADVITTDGTITVVPGTNVTSPWASTDGHIVLSPASVYYVYAYKVEKEDGETSFYIYVSNDGTLDDYCPVTLPTGITPPAGVYESQVVLVASVSWVVPPVTAIPSFVVSQTVIGSITWPNAGGGTPGAEYVNQFELKVVDVDVEGEAVPVLKVASGAHIYRPINSDCDESFYTENLTADTTPSAVVIVPGAGSSRPWASSDGYVSISPGAYYVYVYKVETSTAAQFYIYVSKDATRADDCPVLLPPGITAPIGFYTVQVLFIGSAIYGAGWVIEQNIVGSITWPNANAEIAPPEQFEVRVEAVEDVQVIRVARGRVIAGVGSLPPNAQYQTFLTANKTYEVRNVAVYPTGSAVVGVDSSSVWANDDGYIEIPAGATEVGVYLMRNQNKQFPAFNNLFQGCPYLAIMVRNSDADVKTRPWDDALGGVQTWWSIWLHTQYYIDIENPPPVPPTRFYGEDGNDLGYGAPMFTVKLQNYNCQRFKIADLTLDGVTGVWSVKQYLIGSLTLPHGYCYAGVYRVPWTQLQIGYPTWWVDPDYSANQENWEKNYTGYTKWNGSGVEPTSEVSPL